MNGIDRSAVADGFAELEAIDVFRDLRLKSLHVSSAGFSWLKPPAIATYSRNELLHLYYLMSLTRATDVEIFKMSRKGLAYGKHCSCRGNEATAIGAMTALKDGDWATLAIRDIGAFLARGVAPSCLIAQACGRVGGLSGGWDGSLHMGVRDKKVVGLISHLGTMIPLAVGCSFGERYQGTGNVALSFTGDGTTSTGDVHEALNIASVMNIPLVLVIENNQWAFGTPNSLQFAAPTLALRSLGYGKSVDGYWIDGTDVLTVHHTIGQALERVRATNGVAIVEAVTMRMEGHSLADPFTTYVPAEQLAEWSTRDPIQSFRTRLLEAAIARAADIDGIDRRVADEIRAAATEAEASPRPVPEDIESQVFVPSPVHSNARVSAPASGRTMTYHQAIREALMETLDEDPLAWMIGEDIGVSNGAFKITEGFLARYDNIAWDTEARPDRGGIQQRRIIDAPLAEAGYVGLALGAVLTGLKPIVEFQYADFASEAFKMIVNYAATQNVRNMGPTGIVFRMPSGWATNTSIYHSVNPESWFASTPGLKIVAPITAFDAKGLLKAAVRDNNPVLFLEYKNYYRIKPEKLPRGMNLPVPEEDYVVPIGRARVVQEGDDLTMISFGSQTLRAVDAALQLEAEGTSVEVIDLRTLLPLDVETIAASVRKTGRALVTCEAPRTCSFGAQIVTEIMRTCFEYLDAPVQLVAAADTPVPFAPALEEAHLPTAAKVAAAARELLRY
jgi:2-oxoisovalerate dehydrogenase E1 component